MGDKKKVVAKPAQSSGQAMVSAISAAVEKGIAASFKPYVDAQNKTNQNFAQALEKLNASQEEVIKGFHELALGKLEAASEEIEVNAARDASDPSMAADASDPSMAADASDPSMAMAKDASDPTDPSDPTDDASDPSMEAEAKATDSVDPTSYSDSDQDDTGSGSTPGDLNPNAESNAKAQSKGGSNQMAPGGSKSSPAIAASRKTGVAVAQINAAAKVIKSLQAEREQLKKENSKLRNRVAAIEASLERYADRVERKSISPEISALLEKSGYDVRELMASHQKLSVNEVDQMFASAGVPLEPQMRAAFKNQLLEKGLMETGEVRRFN